MVIKHNLSSSNAKIQLGIITNEQTKIGENLSSGYRINRAADDAAGLSISEKMRSLIRGLNQGSENAQDGISLIQTAEGALDEVHSMLQRMHELSVQAANDTNTTDERENIQDEIDELTKQVDCISNQTTFNGIKLLDGTLAAKSSNSEVSSSTSSGSMSLKDLLNSNSKNLNIIYLDESSDFQTITSYMGSNTIAGYDTLKHVLQTEIVPQAVTSILNAFSPALDYLSSSSIGIGLNLYSNSSSSTLATAWLSYTDYPDGSVAHNMLGYELSINMGSLDFDTDGSGNLTEDSRTALETTIVHEMVHSLMYESVTNGMVGVSNGYIDSSESFPKWFTEGMAQCAAGGYANCNDWVNGTLGITTSKSESQISSIIKSASKSLSSGTSASYYGTGYLACMYLGYLASGSSDISATSIGNGLGKILNELTNGKSLETVIYDQTGGKYTSISDFQHKFGDSDSSDFIYNLTSIVGSSGNGGIASGNLADSDMLSNTSISTSLFKLDTINDWISNIYPDGIDVFNGGTRTRNETPITNQGVKLQIGAQANETMTIAIDSAKTSDLGIDNLSVLTQDAAEKTISTCEGAIDTVSKIRCNLGAYQNRLEHTIASLDTTSENMQNAESRIRDVDMAKAIMEYTKLNVLMKSGLAMLSQASQSTENVLALLQ